MRLLPLLVVSVACARSGFDRLEDRTPGDDVTSRQLVVEMLFPPPGTDLGGMIGPVTFQGRVRDLSGGAVTAADIAAVTINGDPVVPDPSEPGRFTYDTVLGAGDQSITVEVGSGSVDYPVENNALVLEAWQFKEAAGRAYVADAAQDAIVAVDLATGARTLITGGGYGSGPGLGQPEALGVDNTGAVAYGVDRTSGDVIEVDIATGARRVVYAAGAALFTYGMEYDSAEQLLYIADDGLNEIVEVDPSGAVHRVVSGDGVGTGPAFNYPRDMVVDSNRLFVVDSSRVFEVSITDGTRRIVSDDAVGSGPALGWGSGLGYDAANDDLIVGDYNKILRVDVATGDRTIIADAFTGSGPDPSGGTLRLVGGAAIVMTGDQFLSLDLASGDRATIAPYRRGTGPALFDPMGIALEPGADKPLVSDYATGIYRIDPIRGDRVGLTGELNTFDIVIDPASGRCVVGDWSALFALDRSDGTMTTIADATTGTGPALISGRGLALDGGRALVVGGGAAVMAVDLATGDRSWLTGGGVGVGPDLVRAEAVLARGPDIWVADSTLAAVVHVAPNGDRTIIADETTGSGPVLTYPGEIILAADGVSLLVGASSEIVEVDPATGDRRTVSGATVGTGFPITEASGLALAPDGSSAWVVDWMMRVLFLVDLGTGDRVVIANSNSNPT